VSGKSRKLRDQCDELCRRIVRRRVMCERCRSARGSDTAHLIRRGYARTRCDLNNLVWLCRPCHEAVDRDPVVKDAFAVGHLGEAAWDRLCRAAVVAEPVGEQFWSDTRARLKAAL
jgi:hypothetical protein